MMMTEGLQQPKLSGQQVSPCPDKTYISYYDILISIRRPNLAEFDISGLFLDNALRHLSMLSREVIGKTVERSHITALTLPPLACHAHPGAGGLVLQAGLGPGAGEQGRAAKGTKLAGRCLFIA